MKPSRARTMATRPVASRPVIAVAATSAGVGAMTPDTAAREVGAAMRSISDALAVIADVLEVAQLPSAAAARTTEGLLTIAEACKALHCSRSALATLFQRGTLRRIHIPGVGVRVARADIEALAGQGGQE